MKKVTRYVFTIAAILIFSLCVITTFADPPADPPPLPGHHGLGGNIGAPIDGGLSILLALGLGYGSRKIYFLRKKKEETKEAGELASWRVGELVS